MYGCICSDGGDRWYGCDCGCEWDRGKSARSSQSCQYNNTKVDCRLWITNKHYDTYTFLTQTQKTNHQLDEK